jgi:3-deoxy-manno-octulosonate cytidylyltransferase (CMP-KDO synthetase)
VVRVWQRVASLGIADRVVIATDSDEVADVAIASGAEVVMTSASHGSGTERVAEVARLAEFAEFGAVINVQGDEPFVSRHALVGAARMVADAGFSVGTAAVIATPEILGNPDVVKVVAARDGRAMYFSRAAIPFLRNHDDADLRRAYIWQHIGVYAYESSALMRWVELPESPLEQIERLEQLRPLGAGISIGVSMVDEPVRPGIDIEEDLARANREWTAFTTG